MSLATIYNVVNFFVVNCLSVYNIIMSISSLNIIKAITYTYHLAIKFPTEKGVSSVRGDQHEVRKYYVNGLKEKDTIKAAMQINDLCVTSAAQNLSLGREGARIQDLRVSY